MTSVSRYLRISAVILLGLCGAIWIIGTLRMIEPIAICIYVPIIFMVTVGMMYLAWKRPFIAGILLFGMSLLLVWLIEATARPYLVNLGVMIWDQLKLIGERIGPLLLASILLHASWLIHHRSLKRAATQLEKSTPGKSLRKKLESGDEKWSGVTSFQQTLDLALSGRHSIPPIDP